MNELRERLIGVIARDPEPTRFTYAADERRVDAILAEIDKAHWLVDRRYVTWHTCPIDNHFWECIKTGGKVDLSGGDE